MSMRKILNCLRKLIYLKSIFFILFFGGLIMIWDIILVLLSLLGFEDNSPKYDLRKKQQPVILNDAQIIFIMIVLGLIIFGGIFVLCGHCTDSGVFYNSQLY